MNLIQVAEQAFVNEAAASYPKFKAGDTITVTYKIKEGDKFRLQNFRGVVMGIKGASPFTKTFTIRKISGGIGVERIFPFNSPFINSIELNKIGKVRRAKINYLRNLSGKKARIKEKTRVILAAENNSASENGETAEA
ncbi:MAG: 50S ribosomal protein L19 [Bacteroidales bacterium]|nr:50S ribosomal protein L19 [Bacteroidales bacterium]